MSVTNTCIICGKTFEARRKSACCSQACNLIKWRAAQKGEDAPRRPPKADDVERLSFEPRACIQCGGEFTPQKAWAVDDPFQRGRFCSRKCKENARNATPEHKADVLARYYVRKYGMTQDEAERMRERGCDICGEKNGDSGRWGNLHIDHDHETGKVRGVLCHSCNVLIGHAEDDPARLEAAAAYLRHTE